MQVLRKNVSRCGTCSRGSRGRWVHSVEEYRDEFPENDRKFVTALARGLEILRAFRPGDGFLSNQEIARRTGLPKPTVTRLTYTLTQLGYLTYSQQLERYHLGPGVLALGYALLANYGVRELARPHMQAMADRVDALVSLGARDRLSMLYLESCRGPGALTLRLEVGSRIPMASTAMGRAFLAALPQGERDFLLDRIRQKAGTDWAKLKQSIERAQAQFERLGYVTCMGEWNGDVNSVGTALVLPAYNDIFAFNCGGPSFLLSRERLDSELGPNLLQMVQNIRTATNRT